MRVNNPTDRVFTLDPGVRGCGLSFWLNRRLWAAMYVPSSERVAVRGTAAIAMASCLAAAIDGYDWTEAVVEWPVQRLATAGMANREDLTDLTGVAAACALVFAARGAHVRSWIPEEWKGGVPKEIHTARVVGGVVAARRLPRPKGFKSGAKGQLSADELGRIVWTKRRELNHNIVDSIGIGLKYYRRNV